jgi:hypothetical protein
MPTVHWQVADLTWVSLQKLAFSELLTVDMAFKALDQSIQKIFSLIIVY